MFKTIVVGTDGSASAAEAVAKAGQLAEMSGATLHVVTAFKPATELIMHPEFSGLPMDIQSLVNPDEDAQKIAAAAAATLERQGVTAKAYAKAGGAADVLINVAEQLNADLVVIGNRGMTGARRILGSVPNSVSHHAPCSVMIVSTS